MQDLTRYRCKESDCTKVFYTLVENTASSCPHCLGDIARIDGASFIPTLGIRRRKPEERHIKSFDEDETVKATGVGGNRKGCK